MADDQREEDNSSRRSRNSDRQEQKSPQREHRKRSRSPQREKSDARPRRKDAGFKWKDRRRNDDDDTNGRDSGLQRGYRDHYRARSRSRSPRLRSPKHEDTGRERRKDHEAHAENKEKKKEKKAMPAQPQQPMIVVYVNDRLGTKKAIPCFATDPIKDFKVIVASMIGRQPHEILLKRQGERPFKDQLTLQDYGVSNNVQLDLEVDTGD